MNEQRLTKKISDKAKILKSRANIGREDMKRHDLIRLDEQKMMRVAYNQLGWSFAKIGSIFSRDPRTVRRAILSYEATSSIIVPSLCIGSPRTTLFTDRLDLARFASVEVSAASGIEAKGCWGWVKVLPSGPSLPLHGGGTAFTAEQTNTSRIIIRPEKAANLNVAVAMPSRKVIEMSLQAEPCREVPVFFTSSTQQPPWHGEGCWLAQPSALDNPDPRLEAYLTPGVYNINVSVGCEDGEGDSREFILQSPDSWEGLALLPK